MGDRTPLVACEAQSAREAHRRTASHEELRGRGGGRNGVEEEGSVSDDLAPGSGALHLKERGRSNE
jgi:hypothetical protein